MRKVLRSRCCVLQLAGAVRRSALLFGAGGALAVLLPCTLTLW